MLFAQKGGLAATKSTDENKRVSSRLGKLWRSLSTTDKEPYQRKAAEAAALHRKKYPDDVYYAREARRRKQEEHRAKDVTGKFEKDSSGDQEQQPNTSPAAAQGRVTMVFQQQYHPPSTQRNKCRATNQRVSSKQWLSLSATNKEPYQRKAAEAAAVHQRKYPDYMYNSSETRRHKEPERRAKVARELENDNSRDQEQQPNTSQAAAVHRRKYPEYVYNSSDTRRRNLQEHRSKEVASKLENGSYGVQEQQPSPSEDATTHRRKYPDYVYNSSETRRRKELELIAKEVASELENDSARDQEQQPSTYESSAIHRRKYPDYVYNSSETRRRKEQERRAKFASKLENDNSRDQEQQPNTFEAAAVHRRSYPDYVYNSSETRRRKLQVHRAKEVVSKLENDDAGDQQQQPRTSEDSAVHRRRYPDYVYNSSETRQRKLQEYRAKEVASKLESDGSGDQEQQPSTSDDSAVHRRKYPDYMYNSSETRRRKFQEYRAKEVASKLENDGSGEQEQLPSTSEDSAVHRMKYTDYVYNSSETRCRKLQEYRAKEVASNLENDGSGDQEQQSSTSDDSAVHRRKYPDYMYNSSETRRRKFQEYRAKEVASKLENDSSRDQEQQPSTYESSAVHRKKYPDYVYNSSETRRRQEQERKTKEVASKLENDGSGDQEQQPSTSEAAAVHRRKYPDQVYNSRETRRCKEQKRRAKEVASELENDRLRDQEQQPSTSEAAAVHRRKYPDYVYNSSETRRRKLQVHRAKEVASKLENDSSRDQEQQLSTYEASAVHRKKYPDYVYNSSETRRRQEQERKTKEVASKLENDGSGDQEQQPSTSEAAAVHRRKYPDYVYNSSETRRRKLQVHRAKDDAGDQQQQPRTSEDAAVHRRKYSDYVYNSSETRRRKEQERRAKEVASKLENDSSRDQEQQPSTSEDSAVHRKKYPDYVYNSSETRRRQEQEHKTKEVASKLENDGSGDQEQQPSTSEAAAVHRRNYPDYVYSSSETRRRKEQEPRAKEVASKLENDSSRDHEQKPSTSEAAAVNRRKFPDYVYNSSEIRRRWSRSEGPRRFPANSRTTVPGIRSRNRDLSLPRPRVEALMCSSCIRVHRHHLIRKGTNVVQQTARQQSTGQAMAVFQRYRQAALPV
ncbi:trichohyalin-like [Dermacentor silvarum]|uniref:trichohyalin-like n=1 Tax=Dermacentor silvarum TaxID=543639 RepID=UPI00189B39FB|nr:trichohyalin-like [Dermacentor silvarum]